MARSKNIFSTLAVLAVASATAPADDALALELLETSVQAAGRLCPCPASADDLAADVALRLWTRHRDVLDAGDFRPYVETSIRNAWFDEMRKRSRSPLALDIQGENTEGEENTDPADSTTEDPEALAATNEFRDSLSSSDREVLDHLEAGRTDRQIAPLMNRTRHWVRRSVQRIRQQARLYFLDGAASA